jgi:hypothetical protein
MGSVRDKLWGQNLDGCWVKYQVLLLRRPVGGPRKVAVTPTVNSHSQLRLHAHFLILYLHFSFHGGRGKRMGWGK